MSEHDHPALSAWREAAYGGSWNTLRSAGDALAAAFESVVRERDALATRGFELNRDCYRLTQEGIHERAKVERARALMDRARDVLAYFVNRAVEGEEGRRWRADDSDYRCVTTHGVIRKAGSVHDEIRAYLSSPESPATNDGGERPDPICTGCDALLSKCLHDRNALNSIQCCPECDHGHGTGRSKGGAS